MRGGSTSVVRHVNGPGDNCCRGVEVCGTWQARGEGARGYKLEVRMVKGLQGTTKACRSCNQLRAVRE